MAFLYASVGHGGASGYLALMALLGFSSLVMKPTALLLNVMVSLIAFISFYKAKHFKSTLQSYTVLDGVKLGILTVTIISEASYAYYKFSIKTQFMKLSKLCGTVCH